jgi:chromosome segregation ATPase
MPARALDGTGFAFVEHKARARRSETILRGDAAMFEENALFEVSEVPNVHESTIEPGIANSHTGGAITNGHPQPGTKSHQELDSQANLLFGLIRDFKLLADRACDAAVREGRNAAKLEEMASAELTSLRLQLKEKIEALDARDRILREREVAAKERIDSLETAVRDKEEQLENCQTRARVLLGEIDSLNARLNEAASAMKQAEARFRDFADHQQGKISFLNQELKNKDNLLQAKDSEARLAIDSLEDRLNAIDAILQIKDAELREKQAAIETNAAHEKTFAQLMQQLAVESQALMAELWEKNELVAELENKTYRSFDNGLALEQSGAVQERLV